MKLVEIRPGLWRWTASHPDWEPDHAHDSPGDWPVEVGCVAYRQSDSFTLIDPLVEDDDWTDLDELVEASGAPVHVLLTIQFHKRSCAEALERYGGSNDVATGVAEVGFRRADERMFWIPEHGALVPGDRIIGFGASEGRLRPCPDSWLRYLDTGITGAELRSELRKLLDLPVDVVLVSHGEPVLENGLAELRSALTA